MKYQKTPRFLTICRAFEPVVLTLCHIGLDRDFCEFNFKIHRFLHSSLAHSECIYYIWPHCKSRKPVSDESRDKSEQDCFKIMSVIQDINCESPANKDDISCSVKNCITSNKLLQNSTDICRNCPCETCIYGRCAVCFNEISNNTNLDKDQYFIKLRVDYGQLAYSAMSKWGPVKMGAHHLFLWNNQARLQMNHTISKSSVWRFRGAFIRYSTSIFLII